MLRIVVSVIVGVIALVASGVFFITRYLHTPEFKERVLSTVQEATGSAVEVAEMDISLLRGITLEGVVIADPSGLSDEFLAADRLILHHQLLPLLSRQVQIHRLSLDRPVATMVQGEDAAWNFEQFFSTPSESGAKPVRAPEETSEGERAFDVNLSHLSISDAEISMLNSEGGVMAQVHDLNLVSSGNFLEKRLNAVGNLTAKTVNLGGSLLLRDVSAPVLISPEALKFSAVSGQLAGGDLSGDIVFSSDPEFQYVLNLQLTGADVNALLQEVKMGPEINGKLQASVRMEGRGAFSSMVGQGQVSLVGGRVSHLPAQEFIASLLQVPSLSEVNFEECVVEFTLAGNILKTPIVRLLSPLVQVTGKGSVSLEKNTLDHDMILALSKEVLSQLPAPLLRAFNQGEDGFYTLEFRLWGPFHSPQTNIQQKIARGAAEGLLEKGLEGLKNLFR